MLVAENKPFAGKKSLADNPLVAVLITPIKFPFLGDVPAYYLFLLALFVLYVLVKSILLGLLAGVLMVFIVAWEFYAGVKEGGWKSELKNTAIAILLALVVWFGASWALATPTPINAIVSCSMRPAYERGDLVFLKGGAIHTDYFNYSGLDSEINSTAVVTWQNESWTVNGSILAYCAYSNSQGILDIHCLNLMQSPEQFTESHGPLQFQYGVCPRVYSPDNGTTTSTICVKQTTFDGKVVPYDASYDLIVYGPKPGDLYAQVGDIVHRVRLAVNDSTGTMVYLTKGDNNPVFDLQAYDSTAHMGNSPILMSQIRGHVFARLPFVGNLKLFITPQVLTDPSSLAGCDSNFVTGSR